MTLLWWINLFVFSQNLATATRAWPCAFDLVLNVWTKDLKKKERTMFAFYFLSEFCAQTRNKIAYFLKTTHFSLDLSQISSFNRAKSNLNYGFYRWKSSPQQTFYTNRYFGRPLQVGDYNIIIVDSRFEATNYLPRSWILSLLTTSTTHYTNLPTLLQVKILKKHL